MAQMFCFLSMYLFFLRFLFVFLRFLILSTKKVNFKIGLDQIRNLCMYLSLNSLH